jgi:hypothetical protein
VVTEPPLEELALLAGGVGVLELPDEAELAEETAG